MLRLSPATVLFWLSVATCTIAQILIVRSVLGAGRVPAASAEVPRARGAVEVFWALVPAVALGALLLFTWRAIDARETPRAPASVDAPR